MSQVFRFLVFLIFWVSFLHAEIYSDTTQGVDAALPIGVLSFKWFAGGTPLEDLGEIISSDLRSSGKFNIINVPLIPQQATSIYDIRSKSWIKLGIGVIVIGQVQPAENGSYLISYQLLNTSNTKGSVVLSQNQYKVAKQWLRYAAHSASDEIFERLIGIKGSFRTRIAYIVQAHRGDCFYELCVSDYDGYNQFIIQRSSEPLMSPAWSPDGRMLAYVTFEGGHSALVVKDLTNGAIRQISAFPRHNGAPAFSPDGTRLAFALSKSGSLNLYVMDWISGEITQITDNRSNNTEPSWFPDSKTLAYTSDHGGCPQIYKISVNGGTSDRLTWTGSQNQNAQVSADGKFLVMVHVNDGVQHIAKQDLESGVVEVLTNTVLDETPSISPNGAMVIYSAIMQGRGSVLQLVSTNRRFKGELLVETDGEIQSPAWSLMICHQYTNTV